MEIYVKCPNKGFTLNRHDVQYYFNFLDDLKESGSTNMFGAPKYLMEGFEMCFKEASWIVGLWMHWVQHGEMKDTVEEKNND